MPEALGRSLYLSESDSTPAGCNVPAGVLSLFHCTEKKR